MFQAKETTYKGPEADQPGNQGRLPVAWPRVHLSRVELVPLPGVSAPVSFLRGSGWAGLKVQDQAQGWDSGSPGPWDSIGAGMPIVEAVQQLEWDSLLCPWLAL